MMFGSRLVKRSSIISKWKDAAYRSGRSWSAPPRKEQGESGAEMYQRPRATGWREHSKEAGDPAATAWLRGVAMRRGTRRSRQAALPLREWSDRGVDLGTVRRSLTRQF